jgi:uncharacterized protein (DUF2342 family)
MSDASFGNFGFLSDIMKMMGQFGPDAWKSTSRELAAHVVREEKGDENPDPAVRQRLETLAPVVTRRVEALFGESPEVTAIRPLDLADSALSDWHPLLAGSLRPPTDISLDPSVGGEMAPLFKELSSVVGPLFLGFQAGSAAGHFGLREWSLSHLPLPRQTLQAGVVTKNVADFAKEWSVDLDHALCFAAAHEAIGATFLHRDGMSIALEALLFDAINDATAAQGDIMERLTGLMQGGDLSALTGNPEALIDHIGELADTPATRRLDRAVTLLRAAIDGVALHVTAEIVGPTALLAEAWRRRQRTNETSHAAALFGVSFQRTFHDEATEFVEHVHSHFGWDQVASLTQADGLPFDEELSDVTAWHARVSASPLAN